MAKKVKLSIEEATVLLENRTHLTEDHKKFNKLVGLFKILERKIGAAKRAAQSRIELFKEEHDLITGLPPSASA